MEMINKVMKEYLENINNKDSNYEEILKKEKKTKFSGKKLASIVAVFVAVVALGTASTQIYAKIQWDIKFKEYQNREYEQGSGNIKEAFESGYGEVVDMDYIEQDGIKAKVDSLIITDDYFGANINIQFDENIKLNSETFQFAFAVYDESKNVYGIFTRMHLGKNEKRDNITPYIYQDIGVKYNKNDIYGLQYLDNAGISNISASDRNIVSKIQMGSSKGFPKSKKIYIRVFDLGYYMANIKTNGEPNEVEDFQISDAEWIFEINVPDKFYERQTQELTLKDDIPGVEIKKLYATEIGLTLKIKVDGLTDIVMAGKDMSMQEWDELRKNTINITDEDGNIYYEKTMGTTQEHDIFRMSYEISKDMLNKKFFLNIKIGDKQYSSELIKK